VAFGEALLKETIETWQDCSKERLTLHEAQQICETVLGLFKTLSRIDKRVRDAQQTRETAARS